MERLDSGFTELIHTPSEGKMPTKLIMVNLPVQFEVPYKLVILCGRIRKVGVRPAKRGVIIDPLRLSVMCFVQLD